MDAHPPDTFLYRDEAFHIRGAAFDVYRAMGPGFLEGVYQECLAIEFRRRSVPFEPLKALALNYRGEALRQTYIADFVCYGRIIIELKAVRTLAPEHRAQVINYLRAAEMRLGILINFGATPRVEIERFAL